MKFYFIFFPLIHLCFFFFLSLSKIVERFNFQVFLFHMYMYVRNNVKNRIYFLILQLFISRCLHEFNIYSESKFRLNFLFMRIKRIQLQKNNSKNKYRIFTLSRLLLLSFKPTNQKCAFIFNKHIQIQNSNNNNKRSSIHANTYFKKT